MSFANHDHWFQDLTIIAILRGVTPEEILSIADAVIAAGISVIEIPLNSPRAYESIQQLVATYGDTILCGAGTVLYPDEVEKVLSLRGQLIISPNIDEGVIETSLEKDLLPIPGFFSVTEAFNAIKLGAKYLKLFPANAVGPEYLKSLRAVIPPEIKVFPVGGVSVEQMKSWLLAGADGFGLGSVIYKPGYPAERVHTLASHYTKRLQELANELTQY